MCLREEVTIARIPAPDTTHKLINLNLLNLEQIRRPSLSEDQAMKQAVEEAETKKLAGFVLEFKKGIVAVLDIKKSRVPREHPQVVRHIRNGYYVLRSHTTV